MFKTLFSAFKIKDIRRKLLLTLLLLFIYRLGCWLPIPGFDMAAILEGSNLIQSLPDNGWTKHLKNIAKGAVFDYGQYDNGPYSVHKDPEKKPEQTNAHTEYQAPRMSSFITPSSAASSPTTVVRRTIVKQMPLKKKSNGKKAKGKKRAKGR